MATKASGDGTVTPDVTTSAPQTFDLTLEDYCRQASLTNASELLGGFYHAQTVAGVNKASVAAFDAALLKYRTTPII